MNAKHGFTLVEILIVVVILGILAAMVIPVFGQASTDAKTSALASDLMKVRLQIELYKNQHTGTLPGNGTGSNIATFVESLTGKTNMFGDVGGRYGPYIERIPKNPFTNDDTVRIDTTAPGTGTGWHFNPTTGVFAADDSSDHAQI